MLFTFIIVFIGVCLAEMGDKTQLMVIAMAARYKTKDVFLGVLFAVVLLNGLAVILGGAITRIVAPDIMSVTAGSLFIMFGIASSKSEKDREFKIKEKSRNKIFAIASTFFIAELADKTQISTLTFAAKYPGELFWVFAGAVCGMVIADCLGLFFGKMAANRLPKKYIRWFASFLFIGFGLYTLYAPVSIYFNKTAALLFTIFTAAFVLTLIFILSQKKN